MFLFIYLFFVTLHCIVLTFSQVFPCFWEHRLFRNFGLDSWIRLVSFDCVLNYFNLSQHNNTFKVPTGPNASSDKSKNSFFLSPKSNFAWPLSEFWHI